MPRPDAYTLQHDRLGKYIRLYPIPLDELPAHPNLPGWPPTAENTGPETTAAPDTQPDNGAATATQPDDRAASATPRRRSDTSRASNSHIPTGVAPWLETLDAGGDQPVHATAPPHGLPRTERPPSPPRENGHAPADPDAITPAPAEAPSEAPPSDPADNIDGATLHEQATTAGSPRSRASSDPASRRGARPFPRQRGPGIIVYTGASADRAAAARGPPLSLEGERRARAAWAERYPNGMDDAALARMPPRLRPAWERRHEPLPDPRDDPLGDTIVPLAGPAAPAGGGGVQRPQTSAGHFSRPTVPSEAFLRQAFIPETLTADGLVPGSLPLPPDRRSGPTVAMIEDILRRNDEPGAAATGAATQPQAEPALLAPTVYAPPPAQTTDAAPPVPTAEAATPAATAEAAPSQPDAPENPSHAPEAARPSQRGTAQSSTAHTVSSGNYNIWGEPVAPLTRPTPPTSTGHAAPHTPDAPDARSGHPSGKGHTGTAPGNRPAAPTPLRRPALAAFVRAVYYEAEAFMNHSYARTFLSAGFRGSRPADARVEIRERRVQRHQLEAVTWAENETWRAKPAGTLDEKGRWEAPWAESWFARRSVHKDSPQMGTASLSEFDEGIRTEHSKHEMEYTPDVYDMREIMDWTEQLRGVDLGRDIEEVDMRSTISLSFPILPPFGSLCLDAHWTWWSPG